LRIRARAARSIRSMATYGRAVERPRPKNFQPVERRALHRAERRSLDTAAAIRPRDLRGRLPPRLVSHPSSTRLLPSRLQKGRRSPRSQPLLLDIDRGHPVNARARRRPSKRVDRTGWRTVSESSPSLVEMKRRLIQVEPMRSFNPSTIHRSSNSLHRPCPPGGMGDQPAEQGRKVGA